MSPLEVYGFLAHALEQEEDGVCKFDADLVRLMAEALRWAWFPVQGGLRPMPTKDEAAKLNNEATTLHNSYVDWKGLPNFVDIDPAKHNLATAQMTLNCPTCNRPMLEKGEAPEGDSSFHDVVTEFLKVDHLASVQDKVLRLQKVFRFARREAAAQPERED